jgi:hypothetical protein
MQSVERRKAGGPNGAPAISLSPSTGWKTRMDALGHPYTPVSSLGRTLGQLRAEGSRPAS